MKLLVTGAAGFIGSNFVYHTLDQLPDCYMVGLDKLTYAGNLDNLSALTPAQLLRFAFVRGDINDQKLLHELFDKYDFDWVINFAAESHVDRSIDQPGVFMETNVVGTHALLEIFRSHWKTDLGWREGKRYLQVSTDEVYGSLGPTGFFTEKTPLDPHSPYSASKAAADLMVKAYHTTYGAPVLVSRCTNNYGPYQFPEKMIPLMIHHAKNHLDLPVYGDGGQVRDWLYVDDHCRALLLILQQGRLGEVYNIGGNHELTNLSLVEQILSILRESTGDATIDERLIRHVSDRPGHDRRYAMDIAKIRAELGWEPLVKFEKGIRKTVEWYLSNEPWLTRVMSGQYQSFYEKNYQWRLSKSGS